MADVPVDITVCCQTGSTTVVELTEDELAAQAVADQEVLAAQAAAIQAREQALATVAASTDPTIQALAKLLGV